MNSIGIGRVSNLFYQIHGGKLANRAEMLAYFTPDIHLHPLPEGKFPVGNLIDHPGCGFCICGAAVALLDPTLEIIGRPFPQPAKPTLSLLRHGRELLGLTEKESGVLFHISEWSVAWQNLYKRERAKTLAHACSIIAISGDAVGTLRGTP